MKRSKARLSASDKSAQKKERPQRIAVWHDGKEASAPRAQVPKEVRPRQPEKRQDYKTLYVKLSEARDRWATHNKELWDELTSILESVVDPAA